MQVRIFEDIIAAPFEEEKLVQKSRLAIGYGCSQRPTQINDSAQTYYYTNHTIKNNYRTVAVVYSLVSFGSKTTKRGKETRKTVD